MPMQIPVLSAWPTFVVCPSVFGVIGHFASRECIGCTLLMTLCGSGRPQGLLQPGSGLDGLDGLDISDQA